MSAGAMRGDAAEEPLRGHWTVLAIATLAAGLWCYFAVSRHLLLEPLLAFLPGLVVGPLVAGWLASRPKVTGREAALVLAAAHGLIFGGAAVFSVAMASGAAEAEALSDHYTISVYAEFGAWFGAAYTCALSALACLRPVRHAAWFDGLAAPMLLGLGLFWGACCTIVEPARVGLPSHPAISGAALVLLVYVSARSGGGTEPHRAPLARLFGALALACGSILDGFFGRGWGFHSGGGMSANPADRYAVQAAHFQQEQAETQLLVALAVAIAAGSLFALLRSPKFSARGLVAVGFIAVLGASTLLEHEVWARHAVVQRGLLAEVPGQPLVERSLTIEPLAGPLFGYAHPMRKDATGPRWLLEPAVVRGMEAAPETPIGLLDLPQQ